MWPDGKQKKQKLLGGVKYSRVMAHESKKKAREHAESIRENGYNARVVNEGGKYPWVVCKSTTKRKKGR